MNDMKWGELSGLFIVVFLTTMVLIYVLVQK